VTGQQKPLTKRQKYQIDVEHLIWELHERWAKVRVLLNDEYLSSPLDLGDTISANGLEELDSFVPPANVYGAKICVDLHRGWRLEAGGSVSQLDHRILCTTAEHPGGDV
jgi:hypothetical protein